MSGPKLAKAMPGSGLLDWAATGAGGWFGPGAPPRPAAQGTAGRAFDYPAALNLRWAPKQGEGATFAELRALADNYDLLRLAIETRKDELEFCEWQIQTRDGEESAASRRLREDLMTPDREHTCPHRKITAPCA